MLQRINFTLGGIIHHEIVFPEENIRVIQIKVIGSYLFPVFAVYIHFIKGAASIWIEYQPQVIFIVKDWSDSFRIIKFCQHGRLLGPLVKHQPAVSHCESGFIVHKFYKWHQHIIINISAYQIIRYIFSHCTQIIKNNIGFLHTGIQINIGYLQKLPVRWKAHCHRITTVGHGGIAVILFFSFCRIYIVISTARIRHYHCHPSCSRHCNASDGKVCGKAAKLLLCTHYIDISSIIFCNDRHIPAGIYQNILNLVGLIPDYISFAVRTMGTVAAIGQDCVSKSYIRGSCNLFPFHTGNHLIGCINMIPVLFADKDDQNPYHQQDQKDAQETSQLMLTDFLPIILLNLLPLFFFLFKTSYICHNSSIVWFIRPASPVAQSLFSRDFVVGLSPYQNCICRFLLQIVN